MIPLIKNSTDTLVEKFGEMADTGKSYDLFGYTHSLSLASNMHPLISVVNGRSLQDYHLPLSCTIL